MERSAEISAATHSSSYWPDNGMGDFDSTTIIRNPQKYVQLYKELSTHMTTEAQLILSNSKALQREYKLGIIRNLIEASKKNGATTRILCPLDATNSHLVEQIHNESQHVRIVDSKELTINCTFVMIDSDFVRFEITNMQAEDFEDAVGLAIYSKSKPTVDSFRALFNLIWDKTIQTEEFRTREKMKDQFIAVASHELRTPIQPILGYALLAKKGKLSQEVAWDKVLAEARRLQRLANDILDVSKIDSGNLNYFMGNEKINRLLSTILDSMQSELPEGISMNLEFDQVHEDIEIEIDRSRITQAVTNLVGNAIKFTQRGHVLVQSQLFPELNKIEIRVIDTGPGIAQEMLPTLFNKFATRGHGDVQNNKGTGLGLYITRSIIQGHGGRISASNNNNGTGATFTISLPLTQPKGNNNKMNESAPSNLRIHSSIH